MGDLPEMKEYRVRLRVVEEYDVALLARSATEAKSQAEADVPTFAEADSSKPFRTAGQKWPDACAPKGTDPRVSASDTASTSCRGGLTR